MTPRAGEQAPCAQLGIILIVTHFPGNVNRAGGGFEIFLFFLSALLTKRPGQGIIIRHGVMTKPRLPPSWRSLDTEKYSRGRRGAPAKGVGRDDRRESSNLSFSVKQKPP